MCDELLRPGEKLVCARCAGRMPLIDGPRCLRCGRPLSRQEQEYCSGCVRESHTFIRGECTFRYEKALRRAVLSMKFKNRRDYLDFFAAAMAYRHEAFLRAVRPAVIVPVPMHPKKKAARGYDQCELLARRLGRLTGIPVCARSLVRVKYTTPQKGLGREERRQNLTNAFAVKDPGPLGSPVLLLDDIYTTGSTLDAAGQTLREAGFPEIYFLALCTGEDTGL